jgi:hypothetical protein
LPTEAPLAMKASLLRSKAASSHLIESSTQHCHTTCQRLPLHTSAASPLQDILPNIA